MNRLGIPLLAFAASCSEVDYAANKGLFGATDTASCSNEPVNWLTDADGDGYAEASGTITADTCPPDESSILEDENLGDDCDDTRSNVFPGADESCDDVDNDCDGTTDEDAVDALAWYTDEDEDYYGDADATPQYACDPPMGMVTDHTDCDDTSKLVYPDAPEDCTNGMDDDCDGNIYDQDQCWAGEFDVLSGGTGIVRVLSEDAEARAGTTLAAGDIDCDGQTDLIIGAPGLEYSGRAAAGGLYALMAPQTDLVSDGMITLYRHFAAVQGDDADGELGAIVAVMDMDGDPCADISAIAPGGGTYGVAEFYTVLGGEDLTQYGTSEETYPVVQYDPDEDSESPPENDIPWTETDGVVGFDGNTDSRHVLFGATDVLVGDGTMWGIAYMVTPDFMLGNAGEEDVAHLFYSETQGGFGTSVAGLDLTGDSFDDVVIGSPDESRAYLGTKVEVPDADMIVEASLLPFIEDTTTPSGGFGGIVRSAGSINDDILEDLLVAGYDDAFLFYGTGDPTSYVDTTSAAWRISNDEEDESDLISVAAIGDINGDGKTDFAVGRIFEADLSSDVGVFYGPLSGEVLYSSAQAKLTGLVGSDFGRVIIPLGDLNEDGYDDFAVGAPTDESLGEFEAGGVYLFYGRG